MDPELKKALLALRDDSVMAINKKANQMMQRLKEANLMWEQVIPPMQMLVHPANRSGQMLNCNDAHSKGAMVLTIGCCCIVH